MGAELIVQDSSNVVSPRISDVSEILSAPLRGRERIDYLASQRLGARVQSLWMDDLAAGVYHVRWGADEDVEHARRIQKKYKSLKIGLVDAVVMAVAERVSASGIVTLDLRHFGAVKLAGAPKLYPRDLS